jgi:DNA-directed RNA polymerase beta' subunit
MADILVYPVRVFALNIDKMTDLVNSGGANYISRGNKRINLKYALVKSGTRIMEGDFIIRGGLRIHVGSDGRTMELADGDSIERDGKLIPMVSPTNRTFKLKIGDIVERKLQDGDMVLLNRQPTLHKGSLIGMKIRRMSGKTIRMNLAVTKMFNGDFDGDEMNVHTAMDLEATAELRELSTPGAVFMNAQSSTANISLVQDTVISHYLMTRNGDDVPERVFNQVIMTLLTIGDWTMDYVNTKLAFIRKTIEEIKEKFGETINLYSGKALFSMLLPNNFLYTRRNNADPNDPIVKIYKGVLYKGVVSKELLGGGHYSVLQLLYKEYTPKIAISFVNNAQFMATEWLLYCGFSIGLGDCVPKSPAGAIEDVVTKCVFEAEHIEKTTHNPVAREMKVSACLNKAKDRGAKIARDYLDKDNGFVASGDSGAKGSFGNITQITSLLGPQSIAGERIDPKMNNGHRVYYHYPKKIKDPLMRYQSRGFITGSFYQGLSPRDFISHATSSRVSLIDTPINTSKSGYIQRRCTKILEDLVIATDGSVRNVSGSIISQTYGGDNYSGEMTVIKDGKPTFCDVGRLADRLNLDHEMGN